jgi:gliding motility-associated-like protein
LPVLKPNPVLEQCISENDNNPTVNLTTAEFSISESQNTAFTYFEDAAGTTPINNETSYPVTVNAVQSVFVAVTSEFNCRRPLIELTINIGKTPNNPYQEIQPASCDDFLDTNGNDTPGSNNDTDNITNFFLDENKIINEIDPPVNTNVFFYQNREDRNNTQNEIDITNYRNDISKINSTTIPNGIQFPIYYKILSTVNNNCEGLGEFYLQINSIPTANLAPALERCDDINDGDNTNGIVQSFNLESQTATVLGTQNSTDFTVSYHLSKTDASNGTEPQASLFENTTRDLQIIYVRVTNNATGCFTDRSSFELRVNALPMANFVNNLEICDDASDGSTRNGFSQTINLENQTPGILATQDPTIHSVTYHRSLAAAQSGSNPLISPYSNQTPYRETIHVRVYNTNTECANGISNFEVLVQPEPTFEMISNLSQCDDDSDGDATNGRVASIDLDGKIPEILGASQDPDDFKVTFHLDSTFADAPIKSPYANTNANETIYVSIQNKATSCINDDAFFELIINPLPDFSVTSPQIVCLNDLPLTITVENPSDSYAYVWTDGNGIEISTDPEAPVTAAGKYTVTATTTNGTNCTRIENIQINESNPANLEDRFVTIVDEGNAIGNSGNLSIVIDTINNDLGPGDYQFALRNDDKNTRTPFQNEPIFENLEGGIYSILVNDKNGCRPDATLQVSVLQFPKFFTPNGDGTNDRWIIKGANKIFYPNSSIAIFNRFGKRVAEIPIESQGWNGTYNGKRLASDDYWYNITLIPADKTKPTVNKKGNFSLLRR